MKATLIAALILTATIARAESYIVNGKRTDSKADAVLTMVKDPKATVERCNEVVLTKSLTFRNKPKSNSNELFNQ